MENEGSEYSDIIDLIIEEFAKEKFINNSGYDIEELFDYRGVDFIDMFEPIVLKSTKKGRPHVFTNIESEEDFVSADDFFDFLNDYGSIGITKGEFKKSISPEMREILLKRHLLSAYTHLYWNNSHIYDKEIDDIVNVDIEAVNLDEKIEHFLSIFKYEYNYHGGLGAQLYSHPDETGYIVPEYPLLKMQQDYPSIEKTFSKIVEDFKLEKDFSLSKVTELGFYRDLIEKQLQRQLVQLVKFNEQIKFFLISYYRVIEISILQLHSNKMSGEKNKTASKDWFFCLNMFKAIYETFYTNLTDDEVIEFHCRELKRNPYLPKVMKLSLIELIKTSYLKKKPIIFVAREISLKMRVTEAIIEGFIMDDSLKNLSDVTVSLTYPKLPDPYETAIDFVEDPDNTSGTYKADEIVPTMRVTRDYVIKNKFQPMHRKIQTIAKLVKNSKAGLGARKRWVEYYLEKAGIPF